MLELNYVLDILENDSVLEHMLQGDVVLIETNPSLLQKLFPVLLANLSSEKTAVVLLVQHSYFDMLSFCKTNGVNSSNMFFIDSVSRRENQSVPKTGHVVDVASVSQINSVVDTLFADSSSFLDSSFLSVDSLNSLIVSYGGSDFPKFFHILLTKLRSRGVGCLLFSVQDVVVDDLRAELLQLFDTTLHF